MSTHTTQLIDTDPDEADRVAIESAACDLVRQADALGMVLTVHQVPKQPPAMGSYTTVVEVRPRLKRHLGRVDWWSVCMLAAAACLVAAIKFLPAVPLPAATPQQPSKCGASK